MARLVPRLGVSRYEADEYYKMALEDYRKKNLEEAILNLTHAIELLPNHAEYYAARGFFRLEDGDAKKAEMDFVEALKYNKYELMANYGRGMIAYQDKNWEEARAHFSDAWAANPQRAETLYYLGLVYHRLNENDKALGWMKQAQQAYEAADDSRNARSAERWQREFEKLLEKS